MAMIKGAEQSYRLIVQKQFSTMDPEVPGSRSVLQFITNTSRSQAVEIEHNFFCDGRSVRFGPPGETSVHASKQLLETGLIGVYEFFYEVDRGVRESYLSGIEIRKGLSACLRQSDSPMAVSQP